MITINNSQEVFDAVKSLLKHPLQEELFIMFLDNKCQVLGIKLMGLGDEKAVIFPLKHIAREAIMNVASQIVIIHTHPSDCVEPSRADIGNTEKLKKGLELFGITVADHIIIGKTKYFVFSEEKIHKINQEQTL